MGHHTKTGNQTTVKIDVFADFTHDGTVEDVGDAIKAALHRQNITITDLEQSWYYYELGEVVPDPDPNVQHYTSRYRIITQ